MGIRALQAVVLALAFSLVTAASAFAEKGGEGLYGKADDKVITNFGMGLLVFFALLVTTFSAIQYLLERRKSRK
jgi:phosphatidylglycerophosphate synthase